MIATTRHTVLRAARVTAVVVATCLISTLEAAVDTLEAKTWAQAMFVSPQPSPLVAQFDDAYGVAFRDLNLDRYPDLYVVRFRSINRLFVNQGPAAPVMEYTIESGLGGNFSSYGVQNFELGASAADFNNDGSPDLMIAGWGITTKLFQQDELLSFPEQRHLAEDHFPMDANACVWADVDQDGSLDLFITDEHYANHLLINDQAIRFVNRASEYGVNDAAVSQGAAFGDVDNDGYPDLYVCNWFEPDAFYRNVEGKQFERQELPLQHLTERLNSNGASFGDVNNDGRLDLLVTDRHGHSRLYLNETIPGSNIWQFADETESSGIENPYPAYGCLIADMNNDGWQDIYFSNIGPNRFMLNLGDGRYSLLFEESKPAAGGKKMYSTGSAVADWDLDGDLDLFVSNKDTASIFYVNPLSESHPSIRFQLEGVSSNRDAIGTRIHLYQLSNETEEMNIAGMREVSGGSSYLSFSEPIVHFGVRSTHRYAAEIRFPSGKTKELSNLRPGTIITVTESSGVTMYLTRVAQQAIRQIYQAGFWINLLLFLLLVGLIVGFLILGIRRYNWQNKETAYFLIGALVMAYALFWLLSGSEWTVILLVQSVAMLAATAVLGGFMEKIHRLETRRFEYRKLLEDFSQRLIFIKDNAELYRQMMSAIPAALSVSSGGIYTPGENQAEGGKHFNIVESLRFDAKQSEPIVLDEDHLSLVHLHAHGNYAELLTLLPNLVNRKASLLIPLERNEQVFALILLGPRDDQQEFHAEDIALLQIIARQAAIAIENNIYIEETRELTQKLTEARLQSKYVRELEEKNTSLQQLYRELQDTQGQLIQSEKMASLGQLVAGIAHELNNPISFVYANMKELQQYTVAINELLGILTSGIADPKFLAKIEGKLVELNNKYDLEFIHQDIDHLIEESLHGSERVKEVVKNLRNFSRLDEAEFKDVDIHEGLDSTLILLNNEIRDRITVHKEYGETPEIFCNPGHLNQVFMNLLLNATQAIEKEGDIWIRTSAVGEHIKIQIEDNGKGIPTEITDKIFDPFYTTKPVGKGTGLGLSISYNIIQKHGGQIELGSAIDKGTTFTLLLPIEGPENLKTPRASRVDEDANPGVQ